MYQPIPEGVTSFIADTYALSDSALAIQAASVKADMKGYIITNFSLTTDQLSFVNSINASFYEIVGERLSFYFSNRLDVVLQQNGESGGGGVKVFEYDDETSLTAKGDGSVTASGTFYLITDYILPNP